MDNNYTIDISTTLAHDLTKLTTSDSHRLITLDIKDLYVNIPTTETIDIARTQLLKHNNKNITEQICTLLEMILHKTTLSSKNKFTEPPKEWPWDPPFQASLLKYFYT